MGARFLSLAGVLATAFVLAGCPAPPPEAGPPPAPTPATSASPAVVRDNSSVPPAPELPDPRPNLPPVGAVTPPDTAASASAPPGGDVNRIGPDEAPANALEVNVYSVQAFNSSTRANAEAFADRVRTATTEPVDVVQESDGNWRVYVGSSVNRAPIDALRDKLNASGFTGCWTRQRLVRTTTEDTNVPPGQAVYSVQVFVSSSEENARRVADDVKTKTTLPVEVVRMGTYWKVFVGRNADRGPIDDERDRLRADGYPDAWTYLREGTP